MTKCEYCGKEIGLLAVRYTWLDKSNNRAMHDKCYEEYKKNPDNIKQIESGKQFQKENTKDNKKTTIALTIIVLLLIVSLIVIFAFEENKNTLLQNNYSSLQSTYHSLQSEHNSLTGDYNELQTTYNNMQSKYYSLQTTYNNLKSSYEILYAPSTLIQNGTIHWRFHKSDGTISEWTAPIDTYRSYIDWPEPTDLLYLSDQNTGETYTVKDLREYVQPDFFANVISGFTDGKTDKQFVQEVVNFKDQIVTYGSGLGDQFRWPAETITEGRGQCGDTTILMASLFKAGENKAHYDLSIFIWYCDAYHITSPQAVNHAIVEVRYADGTNSLIETTTNTLYTYDKIWGWSYQV